MDSRFMTTALSGTSTERKTASRSTKLRTSTAPMNHGRRSARTVEKSMSDAVWPPTWATAPEEPRASGSTSLRRWRTSWPVTSDWGAVVGKT